MREILSIFLFIIITVLFIYSKYSSRTITKKEEPVAFCGTDSKSDLGTAPAIFKSKCASCHLRGSISTGPDLTGIKMRQPYSGWFKDFVTNQDSLIEQGGSYIKAVMNFSPVEYNHSFKELDSTQISSLLEYFEK